MLHFLRRKQNIVKYIIRQSVENVLQVSAATHIADGCLVSLLSRSFHILRVHRPEAGAVISLLCVADLLPAELPFAAYRHCLYFHRAVHGANETSAYSSSLYTLYKQALNSGVRLPCAYDRGKKHRHTPCLVPVRVPV